MNSSLTYWHTCPFVGHTRYSTQGDSDHVNIQPFVVETLQGRIAVAHNGELVNAKALKRKVRWWYHYPDSLYRIPLDQCLGTGALCFLFRYFSLFSVVYETERRLTCMKNCASQCDGQHWSGYETRYVDLCFYVCVEYCCPYSVFTM